MNFKDLNLSDGLYKRYARSDDATGVIPNKETEQVPTTEPVVTDTPIAPQEPVEPVVPAPVEPITEGGEQTDINAQGEDDDLSFDAPEFELNLPDEVSEEEITKLVGDLFDAGDVDGIKDLLIANVKDIKLARDEALKAKEHGTKVSNDGLSLLEKINPIKEKSKELDIIKQNPVLSQLIGKGDEDVAAVMMSYLSEKTGLNLSEIVENKKKEMSGDMSELSSDGDVSLNSIGKGGLGIADGLNSRYSR